MQLMAKDKVGCPKLWLLPQRTKKAADKKGLVLKAGKRLFLLFLQNHDMLRKSAVTKTIALLYLPFFTFNAHLYVHQGTAVQGDGLGSPPKNLAVAQGAGTTLHLPSTFLLLWISLLSSIPTTILSRVPHPPHPQSSPPSPFCPCLLSGQAWEALPFLVSTFL